MSAWGGLLISIFVFWGGIDGLTGRQMGLLVFYFCFLLFFFGG